jgi:hypothetical protein
MYVRSWEHLANHHNVADQANKLNITLACDIIGSGGPDDADSKDRHLNTLTPLDLVICFVTVITGLIDPYAPTD